MKADRCLALYHFCSLYPGGQNTRSQGVLARLREVYDYCPSSAEEHVTILTRPEYEDARAIFVRLVTAEVGDRSGYQSCVCCSADAVSSAAEAYITLCSDCESAECDPHEGCCCSEEEEETKDAEEGGNENDHA